MRETHRAVRREWGRRKRARDSEGGEKMKERHVLLKKLPTPPRSLREETSAITLGCGQTEKNKSRMREEKTLQFGDLERSFYIATDFRIKAKSSSTKETGEESRPKGVDRA